MNDDEQTRSDLNEDLLDLTAGIVSAYLSNNNIATGDVPDLIGAIHKSLRDLAEAPTDNVPTAAPAVQIEESVTDDYIICLEDGKKLKMLKRYLRSQYNMTPDEYRTKWGLPADYPMVAPSYAAQRSSLAKKIGLGQSQPLPYMRPKTTKTGTQ